MTVRSRRYWDSATFIAWLADETINDRAAKCRPVIKAAEAGELIIVTSSLTLVEVIHLRGHPAMTADKESLIRRFFEHEYIVVRQLDRRLAEESRTLIWQHGFKPKDAVHVATAVESRVDQLDTFDEELWLKSGMIGSPPLKIGEPDMPEQLELGDTDDDR